MKVEQTLNTDVTTAFPVDQAIGTLAPGVYVMVAQAAGALADDYDALATQWFIVSDLGLTAFSGNDGIHAFVHSLDTAQPKGAVEVRLLVAQQRGAGAQAHQRYRLRAVRGQPDARRGRRCRRRMLVASDSRGDYAFLEPEVARLRSHRPRRRRPARCRPGSMPSSTPSAASTAPARPCR